MNMRGQGSVRNFGIRSPWSDRSTIDSKIPRTAPGRTLWRRLAANRALEGEHDIAFRGRKIGSSQKAGAWLTPKGTIAVYDHREQELYTYDEYGAFADDEGIDERLRADVADALGEKHVEELDI
jgi:hypothetical protein